MIAKTDLSAASSQGEHKSHVVDWAIRRQRAALLILFFLLIAGIASYNSIPKESEPDIPIPWIYVSMTYEGISPEDAERLLVRPMEKELKSIEGVKEMTSIAGEGHASVTLEFDAGFDGDAALDDVREKVDRAKSKLPEGSDEPTVNEINVALFPVMSISLGGALPERNLLAIARDLRDDIEALGGVLEVDIAGEREELLEVIVDPLILETYSIDFESVLNVVSRNNRLVAAGAIDNGAGRQVMKVSGVIEDLDDIMSMPIKVEAGTVVPFRDVASIKRTFKDPNGFARVNGKQALTLEVKKRLGANIIAVTEEIKAIIAEKEQYWPETLEYNVILDKSKDIITMLEDLQNNVISAIIMVMIVIVGALGLRSSILVGLAIPASFLSSILIINFMGLTLNIVVLFSLILVVGMLVDGAIVVTELASRNQEAGLSSDKAFSKASRRMAWPIIASTATTLAVFLPLIAWPGVVGEFMKFLPITVIICLCASLVVALLFLPVLGASLGGSKIKSEEAQSDNRFTLAYSKVLRALLKRPLLTLLGNISIVVAIMIAYGSFGKGVEFFPDVEPDNAKVLVSARGDLSIYEKDALLKEVERNFFNMPELKSVYARSFNRAQDQMAEDVIGSVDFQFIPWDERRTASVILAEMAEKTKDIPGVKLEFRKADNGPSGGKAIQIQVSAIYPEHIDQTIEILRSHMAKLGGFKDIEDDRALPGIEWQMEVNREGAARAGADIVLIGTAIQLLTNGVKVAEYRPDDTDEEVDINIRFPSQKRTLEALQSLRIQTNVGMVPLGNFVHLKPAPKTGTIKRADSRRAVLLQSEVEEGLLPTDKIQELFASIEGESFQPDVRFKLKGEQQDQQETMTFLGTAFILAIFLMLLILVIQFNSFYQSFLVLSAIVFSTFGVLLGLLITAQPFGVVMVGLGIIALAGIVVNNNIVLIDTYNAYIKDGYRPFDAALATGEIRLRPVLLTAGTTILGLIPMVMAMNIDFIGRDISFGAPSTQWWRQLSSAIAGGLGFATILTLLLTPALLVLGANTSAKWRKFRGKREAPALAEQ
ncbi:acriflavin resistance protein [Oleiphilus sp. HI0009]|nr:MULTISPECIES: efflux RND transporter permease subunit [unclassified Oleiphilus]KZX76425.1 acriflavin resistance protein [Oleiphilus sp. HI0009]KZY65683.1 acriflavin resistance protein [Oleiphilus sp. HI0066]KZY67621.1 acriflavin resistance protein [Oleiphilus sp. HI0067]